MLISVIIPTYNRANFLENTIKSLINQKTNNIYEIISYQMMVVLIIQSLLF